MTKATPYRNPNRLIEDAEPEQQEQVVEQAQVATVVAEEDVVPDVQPNDTWEKRYGDLRRYVATLMAKHKDEIDALNNQLKASTAQRLNLPANEDELSEWANNYPDIARIVETIAINKANQLLEDERKRVNSEIEEVKRAKRENEFEKAWNYLMKLHPDAEQVRSDKKFHEWVATKPARLTAPLYDNVTFDAEAVAEIIKLYKLENKSAETPKKPSTSKASAAAAVDVRPVSKPATEGGKKIWHESEVAKLNRYEYDKYEEEIETAQREGRFVYDIKSARR